MMDIFKIESEIEEVERDVEETSESLEEVHNREEQLKGAVDKLRGDIETSNILKERIGEKEEYRRELQEKIDSYKEQVKILEKQINDAIESNNESAEILHSLELIGEEIQESLEILANRQLLIEKCKEELSDVMEKLNLASAFNESTPMEESASISGGKKAARNAFVESLRYEISGNDKNNVDSASSSSSSEDTDGKDQQVRELEHTKNKNRDEDIDREDGIISSIRKRKTDEYTVGKTGNVRNQILNDFDPCIKQFGWKIKQRDFSLEEDLKAVNPGFHTGGEKRRRNCQRCVIAMEARLRGADVIATDRIFDGTDTLPIMDDPNGWPSCFENSVLTKCAGQTGLDTGDCVKYEMEKYGEGARAIVRVQWCNIVIVKDKSGKRHPYVVDGSNGSVTLRDPKTRKSVSLSAVFPGKDLTGGLIVKERINPYDHRVKELVLESQKTGERIATVSNSGGHVFIALRKNGKTIFCDPQSGNIIKDTDRYFTYAKADCTHVMRIDNLKFTERAKDCCKSL